MYKYCGCETSGPGVIPVERKINNHNKKKIKGE
jgi:hypothetical protein